MDDEFAAKFADPVERITGLLSERVKEEMPMTAAIRMTGLRALNRLFLS